MYYLILVLPSTHPSYLLGIYYPLTLVSYTLNPPYLLKIMALMLGYVNQSI